MEQGRFEGVRVPDPGFPGDTGEVDPELARVLTAYAAEPDDPERYAAALTALATSRLLVPVVAVLGEVEVDEQGLAHDKSSDMAAVLLTGRDGRRALLAFTGVDAMGRWRPDARPVPVTARDAARAALADAADALVVDVAGPASVVVTGRPLRALAGEAPPGEPAGG